ncbi:hypothetical protein B0A48_18904 [Cryoendolithus antarcticus]|uniref:Uncharacterized protein n=1 Tax=Cryoendolithus antarcticus TaxID=1507870 RepID=A0A1V8S7K6_9PEZI|nr:hypothetical protein B0A48_18904 [Cryoendolithus antarcticus]
MGETDNEVVNGCLLVTCIRCVAMIMIKSDTEYVPSLPYSTGKSYANVIVMAVCKSCNDKDEEILGYSTAIRFVEYFKGLKINSFLMEGSNIMKMAGLVTGTSVSMMQFKGNLLFMDKDKMMQKVSCLDKIASLDVTKVDSEDRSQIQVPYLIGGFI